MSRRIWSWQNGTASNDILSAVAVGDDGTVILAGATEGSWGGPIADEKDTEMVVTKLQFSGSERAERWRWQSGWDTRISGIARAWVNAAAIAADGSVFLIGIGQEEKFDFDSVVVHLNSSGEFLWEWKGDSTGADRLEAIAPVGDDSGDIYVAGSTYIEQVSSGYASHFVAYRVSAAGSQVWTWQGGDIGYTYEHFHDAASVDDGDAVVLVGGTSSDLIAVKLDSNGTELWIWDDLDWFHSKSDPHECNAVAVASDTSVVVACTTEGGDSFSEQTDFVAVMLGGTVEDDEAHAVTVTESGDVVLAGYTRGDWTMQNLGGDDFAVVMLSGHDGSVISGWQGGSTGDDEFWAIAGGSNDTVVFAGYTEGDWSVVNVGGQDFLAIGAFASFSGTPTIASPTATEEESPEPSFSTKVLIPLLITLSIFAALLGRWAYRTSRRSSGGGVGNGGGCPCQEERCAAELNTWARARQHAVPVARPLGHREVTVTGGGAVARERGVVPYPHAVAVPATTDADGSGRAWTVVAATVVE